MIRRLAIALLLLAWTPVLAQAPDRTAAPRPTPTLPQAQLTHHTLDVGGRTLKFSGTADSIRLSNAKDEPESDIAFIAWQSEGADPHTRPVTFVFNGGPGMASGWLQVGALGPWRIPLVPVPSAQPEPAPNAETWLDFTDLVFIDPPGTGYSRVLAKDEADRKRIWSVEGDIDLLSEAIRRWLDKNGRTVSPKFIAGESYGGF